MPWKLRQRLMSERGLAIRGWRLITTNQHGRSTLVPRKDGKGIGLEYCKHFSDTPGQARLTPPMDYGVLDRAKRRRRLWRLDDRLGEAKREHQTGQNVVFIHQSELSAAMELWEVPLREGGGLLT